MFQEDLMIRSFYHKQEVCMESTSVTSDRLKRAIERNRSKQAKRSSTMSSTVKTEAPASGWSSRRSTKMRAEPTSTRRTVARQEDDVEFTTSIRKSPRKAPANVGYATSRAVVSTSPVKRKAAPKRKKKKMKGQGFLLKLGWAFAGVLLVRLVFSGGGVLDYYERLELVSDKEKELASFHVENENLVEEIEEIQNSGKYQRKLVRDHLGFIARDEFLILFQGVGSHRPI
ncbi:MAG: cell division protein FtsB [Bacteriovoracaceae bacterium]|jgi:cell division protein FtsB